MQDENDQPKQYRFGSFEIDLTEGELRRQGTRIKVNEKPTSRGFRTEGM